jgi:hypothetical protein
MSPVEAITKAQTISMMLDGRRGVRVEIIDILVWAKHPSGLNSNTG